MSTHQDRRKARAKAKQKEREEATARLPQAGGGKGVPVLIGGHTLSDLARALEVDQSYMSRLSLGKATPSLPLLHRLRDHLGLPSIDAALEALTGRGRSRGVP